MSVAFLLPFEHWCSGHKIRLQLYEFKMLHGGFFDCYRASLPIVYVMITRWKKSDVVIL